MYCRKCGNQLAEDSRFCSKCGTATNITDTKASTTNKNAVKKHKYRPVAVVVGVCLALLTVTAGVFIYNKVQTTNYLKLLAVGSRYIEDQEWEEAVNTYEKASNIKPKEAPPYLRLADVYFEQGDTEKAQEILSKGYEKTKSEEIRKELSYFTSVESADDALACKDYEAAIDYLNAAIDIRPCVAENYLHLAKAYVEEWNLYEANTTLKKGYEATGDSSLYAVSIWGPLSPVEIAYYMAESYIPITRCEYLFSVNGINSYIYAFGKPIAGARYTCEDEKVKYITLLDYDEYWSLAMFPQQMQGLPVFDSVLTYFDLEYSFDNEISAVTYDGMTFVTLDYEDGNCISITAQVDFGSTFSVGDKLFFSYNDKNHISNITYGEVSVDFSYEEDGSFCATIPCYNVTCHYDCAGLWIACREEGGADSFTATSIDGRLMSFDAEDLQASIEYDGNNVKSLEMLWIHDSTHCSADYFYEKINGVDRLVKIEGIPRGGGNAEFLLFYDDEGKVVRIISELGGYDMSLVYAGDRLESYTITGRDLTQSTYVLKYDDVGRYIGKTAVQK